MAEFNTSEMSDEKFDKAINVCKKYANQYKSNPAKSKTYFDTQKRLEASKAKLRETIEKTKEIDLGGESFYDKYVKGKDSSVSINWIGSQVKEHSDETTPLPDNFDTSMQNVTHEPYDFVDATKKVGSDLLNGKGLSNGLVKGSIIVGLSELATKGVSSYLVGQGVLTESFGLLGLAKNLVTNFPSIMSSIGGGINAVFGFSPVIAIAGGALLALKVVPKIKHKFDKEAKKFKDMGAGEVAINKIANETFSAGE